MRHLVRPGIGLVGHQLPNCPCYPFRYTGAQVGDRVWVIVGEADNPDDIKIEPDTIVDVSDFFEQAKAQKERDPTLQLLDPETYLCDFWLEKYSPGHGVSFGEEIYSTFDEAAFVFLQYFVIDFDSYKEALVYLKEERKNYASQGLIEEVT